MRMTLARVALVLLGILAGQPFARAAGAHPWALAGDRLVAVFDLDSPLTARFDAEDARGFAAAVAVLADGTDWP